MYSTCLYVVHTRTCIQPREPFIKPVTRRHFGPAAYETDLRAQLVSSCMSEYVFRTYC